VSEFPKKSCEYFYHLKQFYKNKVAKVDTAEEIDQAFSLTNRIILDLFQTSFDLLSRP